MRAESARPNGAHTPAKPSTPSGKMTFEEYVSARGPWLERVAFLLTGDPHLAADLTQMTLIQVFLHWNAVASADQPDAYVRRVLVNQLRSRQRRRAWNEVVTADPLQMDRATSPPNDLAEERLLIRAYLRDLPPRARAVVVLRYYEDLDVGQVASILGITASAVRATASRALRRLAQLLNENGDTR